MLTKQFRELNRQAQVIENHKNTVNKQETLEEAAENNYPGGDVWTIEQALIRRLAFMNGAKWQQERMYSEEEVLDLLQNFNQNAMEYIKEDEKSIMTSVTLKTWFEQNKKK